MAIISIPHGAVKGEALVAIPRREYVQLKRCYERMVWEEADTDEAIQMFRKEQKQGKLKVAKRFEEIAG